MLRVVEVDGCFSTGFSACTHRGLFTADRHPNRRTCALRGQPTTVEREHGESACFEVRCKKSVELLECRVSGRAHCFAHRATRAKRGTVERGRSEQLGPKIVRKPVGLERWPIQRTTWTGIAGIWLPKPKLAFDIAARESHSRLVECLADRIAALLVLNELSEWTKRHTAWRNRNVDASVVSQELHVHRRKSCVSVSSEPPIQVLSFRRCTRRQHTRYARQEAKPSLKLVELVKKLHQTPSAQRHRSTVPMEGRDSVLHWCELCCAYGACQQRRLSRTLDRAVTDPRTSGIPLSSRNAATRSLSFPPRHPRNPPAE